MSELPILSFLPDQLALSPLVALSAEQYIGSLLDKKGAPRSAEIVSSKACAAHSAILCYALGNEIAPSLVRWLGHFT
jgi:hypothetical protein